MRLKVLLALLVESKYTPGLLMIVFEVLAKILLPC